MPRKAKTNYGSILSDLSCSDVLEEDDDDDDDDDDVRSVSSSAFSSDSSSVGPCYESSSVGTNGISFSIGMGFCWAFLALLFAFTDTTSSSAVQPTTTTVVELVSSTNPIDQAKFFTQQIVDHDHPDTSGKFRQRYYENLNYWKGPGHPIFLILGGEGPLERILYPFVSEVLAERFGAATFNPEHRYVTNTYSCACEELS